LSDTLPESGIEEPGATDGNPRTSSGRRRPRLEVVLISCALLLGVGVLWLTLPDHSASTKPSSFAIFVGVAAGFAAAEYTVFRFLFRREAIAFSLSEIPLAFCLLWLAPGPGLLARAIGTLPLILVVRRPPAYKFVFNVANYAFELLLAYVVFRGFVGAWGDADTQLVVAAILATCVGGIVSSILVSVAISRFEGDLWGRIFTELRLAWWLFIVNATLAGMVLGLALTSPWLVLLAAVPVGMLWYVIKAYGLIDQRLRDLDAVHGFTGRVGQSLDPDEIGKSAVSEAARVLRSDGVALVFFDHGDTVTRQIYGDIGIELPIRPDDAAWADVLDLELPIRLSSKELDERMMKHDGLKEIMVAPVRDESGAFGVIVVRGRPEVARRFEAADLVRLQNLTEQLTTSLRKGMLHQRIEREARVDGLTGLPNRVSFERSLAEMVDRDRRGGLVFVVMLDLDRFKEVNDTLGHQAGDELLIEVAERMRRLLGPGDVLARLASDEFAIVGRRRDREEMLELAWGCVREVGRPVTLDGLEIVVTASAGLAVVEDDTQDDAPLRFADIAMFNAKTQRLGVEVYRDEIDRRTPARLSMLGDLRSAIDEETLHLHLQPKLDLSTGTVVGAEALVRWTHPVRGAVPPAQFVRVAEDTGLIKQLTDLMLHRGIATLRDIHDRGYHLGLSVNLSTHDLLDSRLADRVQQHLARYRVDPAMLTLEITESSLLIDAPRARATINELHEVGVSLSIDDFGTGYSSLSYLRRLPVGELKIDQSFVANVLLDEQDEVIVRSTIDLGHNLGLVVVAEGVENNEVLERLRTLGCDIAQGYCISRPLAPAHFMSWLATTGHPSRRIDPLDFSRWVDAGPEHATPAADPSMD
jgi:diguanylate cyclase (GGDEF)-like protein